MMSLGFLILIVVLSFCLFSLMVYFVWREFFFLCVFNNKRMFLNCELIYKIVNCNIFEGYISIKR